MHRAARPTATIPTLAETWPAPADLHAVRAHLLDQAKSQIALSIADGITGVSVTVAPARTIAVLASPRAKPHVDLDFPAWSALWVLQA
jgi:hypothetical protein